MKRNNKKGFTIVELVIVIAVIAILAGVLIPTFAGIVAKANKSAVEQETRAALTVILAEENGQMDSAAEYFFYYNDDGDISYFKYNHTEGKLEEADATATNVVDKKLDLDVNDVIWYANDNAAVLENDDVEFDADKNAIRAPLSDIENVIVVKVVAGTTNAGLEAAEVVYAEDKAAFGESTKDVKAGDKISENSTDTYKGSFDYVEETADPYVAAHHIYTYVANGYTYVYNSNAEKWTITKN